MNRIALAFAFAGLMFMGGCTDVYVPQGQEAVLITHPFFFGHGGIVTRPVLTGRGFYAPTTNMVYVDMQPQIFAIHFDDFMSNDGVPLDFDVALRLKINNSVRMVEGFGLQPLPLIVGKETYSYPKWYVVNVFKDLEKTVRQAVRKHGMNETAILTTAVEEIDTEVTAAMKTYFEKIQLPVDLIDFTVGRANPPDAIKTQRIETAAQEQRTSTEKKRRLAEIEREKAELQRAASDNAYRNAMQLSPDQFIRLEQIKAMERACVHEKCTFVVTGSGLVPTLPVTK